MGDDRLERRQRAVVKVGRSQLDVAQRRRAEREPMDLIVGKLAAAKVERCALPHAGAELRDPAVGEGLPAEEGAAVAAHAPRPREEQDRATLLLDAQGVSSWRR